MAEASASGYAPDASYGLSSKRKRSDEATGLGASRNTFFSAGAAAADSNAVEEGPKGRTRATGWRFKRLLG